MPLLSALSADDIKVNDPYVGDVYANVLDFFDSPSYNLRLYMVKQSAVKDLQQKLNDGVFNTDQIVSPDDMIVLAQTAVTGVQIDNLEMEALMGYEGAKSTKCTFQIKEPGGASFLDQIQYAKAVLKSDPKTLDNTMFLDIRFQGYRNDIDNNEEAGELVIIAGPITYELKISNIGLRMDENGSEYSFEAIVLNTYSYSDSVFKFPENFDSKGTTITEHIRSIEAELNRLSENNETFAVKDEYEFVLDQVISSSSGDSLTSIGDDTVIMNRDAKEVFGRITTQEAIEPTDAGVAEEDNSTGTIRTNTNRAEQVPETILISHKDGESIETIVERIFANNKEYLYKTTRRKDIEDSASEARTDQAFVAFVKVVTKTYILGYDEKRNRYARKYVFIPILYKTANSNIEDNDTRPKNEKEKVSRLQQLKSGNHLIKSYNYLFTGLNDQIINLDIEYNTGIVSLLAPKGGAIGDPGITNRQLAATQPQGTGFGLFDVIKDITNKAKELSDFSKGLDIFEKLSDISEDLQDEFVTAAESFLGTGTSDAIRAAIGNRDAAEQLLGGLVGQEIASLASAQFLEGGAEVTTEAPSTNLPDGSPYTPELSRYKYSDDFLTADEIQSTIKSVDDLTELGYINVDGVEFVDPEPSAEASKDIASPMDTNAIEVGTVSNKLYGFMSARKGADVFLTQLDMTIRGDPWYLCTSDPLAESTGDQSNFKKGPNCFWLRIGTPRRYDLDWRNEDLNTGFWNVYGHSRAFSGVYQMISVVNKFSGGVFTTDVKGQRIFGLEEPASEDLKKSLDDSFNQRAEEKKRLEQEAKDAVENGKNGASNTQATDDPSTGGSPE